MAPDPLDALRLTLMQEVLPVGLAVVERARKGGPREVLAAFETNPADSLAALRREGEPAASQLRDTLDRVQPGLGNPVMKVEVRDVPGPAGPAAAAGPAMSDLSAEGANASPTAAETAALQQTLARIAERLDELERRLS